MEATTVILLILLLNFLTGSSSLQCSMFEYQSGENCCLKCPAGQRVKNHCTDFKLRTCTRCEEGTFMDQINSLQHCFPCQRCEAASGLRVKTPCSRTSDSVCEPLEGFYCVDSSQGKCAAAKKHSSCQAGQYISKDGSLYEDTECSECSDGRFSTTGSSSWCQPHTQCHSDTPVLIRPGNSTADAQCGPADHTGDIVGVTLIVVIIAGFGVIFYHCYGPVRSTQAANSTQSLMEGSVEPDGLTSVLPVDPQTKDDNEDKPDWIHERIDSRRFLHSSADSKEHY